jgi:hypothetical protein
MLQELPLFDSCGAVHPQKPDRDAATRGQGEIFRDSPTAMLHRDHMIDLVFHQRESL